MNIRSSLILLLCFTAIACSKPIAGDIVIVNINCINVYHGNLESNRDVVIRDGRIHAIFKHRSNRNYVVEQTIDGTGKCLLPGLWDMHTHTWFNFEHSFPLLLANGVTGVRDMFGHVEPCLNLKKKIANGEMVGPDVYFSGPIIEGPNGRKFNLAYDAAHDPDQAREIVKRQKNDGAEFIKVYSALGYEAYLAIAEQAVLLDIPLTGHIPDQVRIEEAVQVGHRSIEHLYGLAEHCSSQNAYYFDVLRGIETDTLLIGQDGHTNRMKFITSTFDEQKMSSLVEILRGEDVWICPTLILNKNYLEVPGSEIHQSDKVHFLPDYITDSWDSRGNPRLEHRVRIGFFEIMEQYYRINLRIIKKLNKAGVNFLAGTDYLNPYCIPGFSLHDELQLFVEEAGFSPLEAIQTATLNPALYFEREDDYGSIDVGKIASLIILSKNPLEDINYTRSIDGLLLRGVYFSSLELQSTIQGMAEENQLPNIWEKIKPVLDNRGLNEAVKLYGELKNNKHHQFNFNREQLIDLGYTLLDEGKIAVAIKVFQWNSKLFPEYWSAFDSLGDGFSAAGDEEQAIVAWNKAVELGSIISSSKIKTKGE